MELKDLKKNVGAEISFRRKSTDWYVQVGVLHEVRGRNLLLDSNWFWYDDLLGLAVVKPPPPKPKPEQKPRKPKVGKTDSDGGGQTST